MWRSGVIVHISLLILLAPNNTYIYTYLRHLYHGQHPISFHLTHSHYISSMKFVVFGGGGKVAQHFARLATGAGHKVISVVRNEDQ